MTHFITLLWHTIGLPAYFLPVICPTKYGSHDGPGLPSTVPASNSFAFHDLKTTIIPFPYNSLDQYHLLSASRDNRISLTGSPCSFYETVSSAHKGQRDGHNGWAQTLVASLSSFHQASSHSLTRSFPIIFFDLPPARSRILFLHLES